VKKTAIVKKSTWREFEDLVRDKPQLCVDAGLEPVRIGLCRRIWRAIKRLVFR